MLQRIFTFFLLILGFAACIYLGWLANVFNSHVHTLFYYYVRFFIAGWVIASVLIGFIGIYKKIGVVKAFFIALFNPALGLVMVLASESKSKANSESDIAPGAKRLKGSGNRLKNTSYSLNN
jgi:hypothetical protein